MADGSVVISVDLSTGDVDKELGRLKKKTALKWWAIGCLGLFGIENFYVGKIKKGIIRFVIGIFILLSLYAMGGDFEGRVPVGIVFPKSKRKETG